MSLESEHALSIHFPEGLFGFPECRHFLLHSAPRTGFYWMQSAEQPALAFMLADPFIYFEDYAVDLPADDGGALESGAATDIAVLVTVTLAGEAEGTCTVNLQGPLVFDVRRGVARQVVVNHPAYGVRQPLPQLPAAA